MTKPNYLAKSLHTVTALVNLAKHLMAQQPPEWLSLHEAVEQAAAILAPGKCDRYHLLAAAQNVLIKEQEKAKAQTKAANWQRDIAGCPKDLADAGAEQARQERLAGCQ